MVAGTPVRILFLLLVSTCAWAQGQPRATIFPAGWFDVHDSLPDWFKASTVYSVEEVRAHATGLYFLIARRTTSSERAKAKKRLLLHTGLDGVLRKAIRVSNFAQDLAIDTEGTVWVFLPRGCLGFSRSGELTGKTEFLPKGVAYSQGLVMGGRILLTGDDEYLREVRDGTVVTLIPARPPAITGLVLSIGLADGRVAILEGQSGRLHFLNPSTGSVQLVELTGAEIEKVRGAYTRDPNVARGLTPVLFNSITADSNGIYVSLTGDSAGFATILGVDGAGRVSHETRLALPAARFGRGPMFPSHIAKVEGRFFVVDRSGRVAVYRDTK